MASTNDFQFGWDFAGDGKDHTALVVSSENIRKIMSQAIEKLENRESLYRGVMGKIDDFEIYKPKLIGAYMKKKTKKVKKLTPIQKVKVDLKNLQEENRILKLYKDALVRLTELVGVSDRQYIIYTDDNAVACKVATGTAEDRIKDAFEKVKKLEAELSDRRGAENISIRALRDENARLWHMVRVAMNDPIITEIAEKISKPDDGTMKCRFDNPDFGKDFL